MKSHGITFPSGCSTEYHFGVVHDELLSLAPPESTIIVSDETVSKIYGEKFKEYRVLTFPAGEKHKTLDTIATLTESLLSTGANRKTMLLGIGGGIVTDVTGFLASIFMRGIRVAFMPTTILGQVDASIGGKNGVNSGLHKNMLGTFHHPDFIVFNADFFSSLPDNEWSNGFAEIIKYGFIADRRIQNTLSDGDIAHFQKHPYKLEELIEGCVDAKNKIVHADESEEGLRCVLNFGHTAGHAIETLYSIPHGQAVGLGMLVALRLSESHTGLGKEYISELRKLLLQYCLPVNIEIRQEELMQLILTDKKRREKGIQYVLLQKPGVPVTKMLMPDEIRAGLKVLQEN